MTIDNSDYLGNATSQTLSRVQISPLDNIEKGNNITPSLVETKIIEIKLPSEEPPVPKVTLKDLTISSDPNADKIALILEKYGLCIVKNFMEDEQLEEVNKELEPHFAKNKDDPRLFPKETVRVTSTVNKSPAVVTEILSHPLHVDVCQRFLDQKNAFWIGENINIGYSPAIVTSSIAFRVGPGATGQALHRDDMSDHNIRQKQDTYKYGSESQVGISVALSKVTKDNGGTKFIPGSHLWDHFRKPHEKEQCLYLEMDKGDACFMLSSIFHGGSDNITKDEFRTLLIIFMCKGTQRQKENIYLGTPIEYFKQFNTHQLKLLGLSMSEPFSNMLELRDPLVDLKPGYVRKSNYSDVGKVVSI
ncbi:PhyH-domain-containing protein [Nadsonia fulvescens var. elongata DSM 6958]|uniref:PhyH-domain-containing protein n=1 Tax=Nadsonia fulvescens var. elongata DSM 6958 TaxID=857566 RepID=A0A1E3PEP0_9ASCO|nr:PhyH-domain-containing protein [Nadsonia fulvescens var. elongata DSM 6958]